MLETLNLFRNIFQKWKYSQAQPSKDQIAEVYRFKYVLFKDLLDSNAQLLNIITDLEEKLQGRQLFGMSYVRSQATRAAFHAFRMIKSLDVLSGHRYPVLYKVLEEINRHLKAELGVRKELPPTALILPYREITKEMVDGVGGKNANLGEALNRVHLPIPKGFAITTAAFAAFLSHNDLVDEINKLKMEIDPRNTETIREVSEEIQRRIISAAIPPDLEEAMTAAYRELTAAAAAPLKVSMRSSAIGEDAELSFAGQYLTLLNVPGEDLPGAYKRIIASLYTPRAVAYRLNQGIRDEDIAMSVACLGMVESVASGVMYSRHPFHLLEDRVVITGVWGLGPYAVDGVITPDTFQVAKDPDLTLVETKVSHKPVQLVSKPEGGLEEVPVPPELQDTPCLTPEQVRTLAGYALSLENHYQSPQDIEWALDPGGRLLVLQTRPLRMEAPEQGGDLAVPPVSGYPLLVENGAVAFPGVGCGPAFPVLTDEDLVNFPEGAVLVARHSSAKFVLAMPKAQAIITESGSVAGHMAAVAREFGVPTILDAHAATSVIPRGREITVDAYTGRVYEGRVPELLALERPRESSLKDTPVYRILRRVADYIVPLHLVDPKSPEFAPESCRSLHDLGRLVHEYSYTEMFQISDLVTARGGGAVKLQAPIPLDLYIIDLGEGLSGVKPGATKVTLEQVASVPFKALLQGMTHKDLQTMEPRPIALGGFFSVMREQMLTPEKGAERFGERSYAIISDKYLNFSSRVGYHYCVLDAYCGQTVNKNYITFSFKGGAADEVRRQRRVRALAIVFIGLDFTVEVKGDRVDARLQKYPCPVIAEKLDQLGRLLHFTRQMDMLMTGEASVEAVAQNFLKGNYHLEPGQLEH
jgi:pyruvate,water dikinase